MTKTGLKSNLATLRTLPTAYGGRIGWYVRDTGRKQLFTGNFAVIAFVKVNRRQGWGTRHTGALAL